MITENNYRVAVFRSIENKNAFHRKRA